MDAVARSVGTISFIKVDVTGMSESIDDEHTHKIHNNSSHSNDIECILASTTIDYANKFLLRRLDFRWRIANVFLHEEQ